VGNKTLASASDDAPQPFIVEFMYQMLSNNIVTFQGSHKVDININKTKTGLSIHQSPKAANQPG
jgi:hypothetical protein